MILIVLTIRHMIYSYFIFSQKYCEIESTLRPTSPWTSSGPTRSFFSFLWRSHVRTESVTKIWNTYSVATASPSVRIIHIYSVLRRTQHAHREAYWTKINRLLSPAHTHLSVMPHVSTANDKIATSIVSKKLTTLRDVIDFILSVLETFSLIDTQLQWLLCQPYSLFAGLLCHCPGLLDFSSG